MADIVIDNKIMGYMQLFERLTGIEAQECLENEDMILFIVGERKLSKLFKFRPDSIGDLKNRTNKRIVIAEYSRDILGFTRNLFFRFGVKEININWREGNISIQVGLNTSDIGKVIGKEGRNVKLFRETLSRNFNVKSVTIKQ